MRYNGCMSIELAARLEGLDESVTLALNAQAKELQRAGKTVYNLTAGELAGDTPDYIATAVAGTLTANKYTPVAGMPELRESLAAETREQYGLDWIKTENVVITGGAKPALYASLLALLNPGDEVILPTPAWVSYNHLIGLTGATVVPAPLTTQFDIDPAVILAKVTPRTKAILLNSPHNPTGAIFSKAALTKLAKALKNSDIMIIADDIYSKLVYDDSFTLVPSCGFKNVIIINGFSKSQALTGWRIGYCIADVKVAAAMTRLLSHMMGNASLPAQNAALTALKRHDKPPAATLAALTKQRQLVVKALNDTPPIKCYRPGGAFYVFFDIRSLTDDSAAWCEQLLRETGVALVPGEAFSAPGFVRLTFVADPAVLRPALKLIKKFVSEHRPA